MAKYGYSLLSGFHILLSFFRYGCVRLIVYFLSRGSNVAPRGVDSVIASAFIVCL